MAIGQPDRTEKLLTGDSLKLFNPKNDRRFKTISKVPVFAQSKDGDPSKVIVPSWLRIAETFTTEYRTQMGMPTYTEYHRPGAHNKMITRIPYILADKFRKRDGSSKYDWVIEQNILPTDDEPWCAPGMAMMCLAAGIPVPPSYTSAKRGFGKGWGTKMEKEQRCLGAALLYSSVYGEGRGHICWYVGEDEENIYVLGCNQDDTIDIQARSKSDPERRLLKVIWPPGKKLPENPQQVPFKDYAASFVDRLTEGRKAAQPPSAIAQSVDMSISSSWFDFLV